MATLVCDQWVHSAPNSVPHGPGESPYVVNRIWRSATRSGALENSHYLLSRLTRANTQPLRGVRL